jgi:hypothetical protein
MGGLGLVGVAREALIRPLHDPWQAPRVGVEQEIHSRLVLRSERRLAPVAVAGPGHGRVVGDVARGLLQIGGQAAALEELGHHVRDPLAGDVGAAELAHRIVPVAKEDPLVEATGAFPFAPVEGPRDAPLEVPRELVEEEPAERSLVARVAGEERSLDRLRQVHEREYRPVEVREVGGERLALVLAEGL